MAHLVDLLLLLIDIGHNLHDPLGEELAIGFVLFTRFVDLFQILVQLLDQVVLLRQLRVQVVNVHAQLLDFVHSRLHLSFPVDKLLLQALTLSLQRRFGVFKLALEVAHLVVVVADLAL